MLGLGSIGYVQSFQYVLINIEPVRPSDYSQFFLALCVFDFDIPALKYSHRIAFRGRSRAGHWGQGHGPVFVFFMGEIS